MNLFELLFLMVRLPFAAVAYSVDAFGRVLGDLAEIGDGGRGLLEDGEYRVAETEDDFAETEHGWTGTLPFGDVAAWPAPLPLFPEDSSFLSHDVRQVPTKEDRKMDQDLSGDMVKVVQYSIVSVVTSAGGGAHVLSYSDPKPNCDESNGHARSLRETNVIAFSDDMTGEDFTSWIMSNHCDAIDRALVHLAGGPSHPKAHSRKYLRVAYSVIGRFAPADINYVELQAGAVHDIAHWLKDHKSETQPNKKRN